MDGKESNDFETTIFIGNLPWVVNEEELRSHFADCGKILNVRVIRDKETFIGKGIAYIQFSTQDEMKKAIDSKSKTEFKGRELRLKKATTNERREKKEKKKRDIKEQRKQDHRDNKKKHFHQRKHSTKREDGEKGDEKDSKRELSKIKPFLENNKKSFSITNDNVDYSNKIAYRGKKDKIKVQEERLESRDKKTSRAEGFKNKVLKP